VPVPDTAPASSCDLGDVANALLLRDVSLLPPLSTGRDPVVLLQAAARRWLCGRERKKRQAFISKLGGSVTDKNQSSGRMRTASGSAPPPAAAAPVPAPESPEQVKEVQLDSPLVRVPAEPPAAPAPTVEAAKMIKSQEEEQQMAPAATTSALPEDIKSDKVTLEAEVAVEVEEMRKRITIDREQEANEAAPPAGIDLFGFRIGIGKLGGFGKAVDRQVGRLQLCDGCGGRVGRAKRGP